MMGIAGFTFLMLTILFTHRYVNTPTYNTLINAISSCLVSIICFILQILNY